MKNLTVICTPLDNTSLYQIQTRHGMNICIEGWKGVIHGKEKICANGLYTCYLNSIGGPGMSYPAHPRGTVK